MSLQPRQRLDAETKIKTLVAAIHGRDSGFGNLPRPRYSAKRLVYLAERELCLRGANLFETKLSPCKVDLSDKKVAALEAKLAEKDGVIAALPQEHVELEKLLD